MTREEAANAALDIAFRGDTDTIDADMRALFDTYVTGAVAYIAQAAHAIGWQAGVGAMETAGSIVSYLAKNPQEIEPFLAGKTSVMDWPMGWHEQGCLTWQGMDGKVHTPQEVRLRRAVKKMGRPA